jgi:hypothetical protein
MSTGSMTARSPASFGGLTGRCRAALGGLAARAHAGGDAYARAMGWDVTPTPGSFGLSGRSYSDPRFATPKTDGRTGSGRRADQGPRRPGLGGHPQAADPAPRLPAGRRERSGA